MNPRLWQKERVKGERDRDREREREREREKVLTPSMANFSFMFS